MRIIHINDKLEIAGGVEVYLRDFIPILTNQGIDARWVALKRTGDQINITSKDGEWDWQGPIRKLANSPMAKWINRETLLHVHSLSEPRVLDELFKLGPVVRHMREPRMVCPGQGKFWAKTERICNKPFGLHCLWHAYTERCCNRHPKRMVHQFGNTHYEIHEAANSYRAIIANSNYMKSEALKVGYQDDKVRVVPNFTEITPEPDWETPQPPIITFAGRLSRTKGLHYLLDSFSQMVRVIPDAKLEILGSGHDEATFRLQAEHLGLGNSVQFHGWADKATIDTYLARAAIVAFPSIYPEAFGITGIEAMMRGKPVVAFDVGGVTDWLRHEETGLLAAQTSSESLASALLRLLNDTSLRVRLGKQARAVALSEFSAKKHLAILIQLYEEALNDVSEEA